MDRAPGGGPSPVGIVLSTAALNLKSQVEIETWLEVWLARHAAAHAQSLTPADRTRTVNA
jgi:hypothetical protein